MPSAGARISSSSRSSTGSGRGTSPTRARYLGAYTEFTSGAEFAAAFESHLRKLIEKRMAPVASAGHEPGTRIWMQAPFRGLESYEFEHAPIFFGQDDALTKAMVQLVANAAAGSPFLLVLGASGSGKSSLVKAGIVPKLFVPRRIPGAAFLRRVMFRPSDAQEGEDLFDALARRLTMQVSADEGLSELIGPDQSVSGLAAHLRNATAEPAYPIAAVLGQLAVVARQDGRMLEHETARLVLVLDQLEELFTNELLTPLERQRFIALIAGLVRSGRVWVIATMRKDFWHQADDTPELVHMSEGQWPARAAAAHSDATEPDDPASRGRGGRRLRTPSDDRRAAQRGHRGGSRPRSRGTAAALLSPGSALSQRCARSPWHRPDRCDLRAARPAGGRDRHPGGSGIGELRARGSPGARFGAVRVGPDGHHGRRRRPRHLEARAAVDVPAGHGATQAGRGAAPVRCAPAGQRCRNGRGADRPCRPRSAHHAMGPGARFRAGQCRSPQDPPPHRGTLRSVARARGNRPRRCTRARATARAGAT